MAQPPVQRILLGGGTGFIGRQLAHFLRWNGYEVTVVSRKPLKNNLTWEDIVRHGLPKRTTSVINLAGENVLDVSKRWNTSFKDSVYESRIRTTCTLAKAIDEAVDKPCSFIVMSGVGIYPPSSHTSYNEDTPVYEYDFMSKLCHHWENASELKDPGCCRTVKIRSGVVLGREGGMINNLYLPYFFGLGGKIGSGSQYLPWIHIDDIINLIYFCMKNEVEGVLNGVAPNTATNKQFTKAFAKAMRRPAIFPIPGFVMNLLLNKERAIMLTHGQCVIPKRTVEYGFQYKYCDIEAACKAVAYMVPKNFK